MTISDKIFERITSLGMTQKRFSELTGIRQSTISEWKSKKTNPTSEKILTICEVLQVTPQWLLSGIDQKDPGEGRMDWYVVDKNSDLGRIVRVYNSMGKKGQSRILGYVEAAEELFAKD